jgi:hypothetical protein
MNLKTISLALISKKPIKEKVGRNKKRGMNEED